MVAIVGDVLGGVDEHDAVGSRPAEEEPQRAQPSGPTERSFGEECLDVAGCGARPVGVGALGDQEAGEVANDGEVLDDGEIGAGSSAGLSGALLTGDQCVGEAGQGGAQRFGGLFDPAAPPCCEALGVVIEWKGQASIDEEVFQRAGNAAVERPDGIRSRRAWGLIGPGSASMRPSRPIISDVRPTQFRAAA